MSANQHFLRYAYVALKTKGKKLFGSFKDGAGKVSFAKISDRRN
jgi:hypothetical protein